MEPPKDIALREITLRSPSVFEQDHLMSLAVLYLIATRSKTNREKVVVNKKLPDDVESCLIEQVINRGA